MNIGSMQARGWEVGLTWRDEIGKDFSYDLGLNLSAVRNKAIKFSGDGPINVGGFNSDQIIRNEDGGFISRFYGYVADGLFQNWEEVYAHTDEHGTLIQPMQNRETSASRTGTITECSMPMTKIISAILILI